MVMRKRRFLPVPVLRPHGFDADVEQFLDRGLDLILGRHGFTWNA